MIDLPSPKSILCLSQAPAWFALASKAISNNATIPAHERIATRPRSLPTMFVLPLAASVARTLIAAGSGTTPSLGAV